jgi:hypothetical protein
MAHSILFVPVKYWAIFTEVFFGFFVKIGNISNENHQLRWVLVGRIVARFQIKYFVAKWGGKDIYWSIGCLQWLRWLNVGRWSVPR